jgi:hypothetical protein
MKPLVPRKNIRKALSALVLATQLLWAGGASAQLPPAGTPSQFDITGFLSEATLDQNCNKGAHCGGTLTVNGHKVTVPDETIVMLPANALTWQEMFAQAPLPWGLNGTAYNGATQGPTSGMALSDCAVAPSGGVCAAPPLTTYEFHIQGNRVGETYIAGLIFMSQQSLNSGAGFINHIDYSLGEMRVGGTLKRNATGVPIDTLDPANPGARVRINDPFGKFAMLQSPDERLTLDPDNPTIKSETGFPMCLPRKAPTPNAAGGLTTNDLLCPEENRLLDPTGAFVGSFTMQDPVANPGTFPDPTKMAPFEVGDYITYAGTLVSDAAEPTTSPWPATGSAGTYISAHTITNNIAIYTAAGTSPAYVSVDVGLIGTGGLTIIGATEAVARTRFEGMTTDPSRQIHLYGVDFNSDGSLVTALRDFGTIGVDQGAPTGAVKGRWRFRPPCATFGTVPTKPDKQCVMNLSGTFLPPPREVRAVIEGQQSQANPATAQTIAGLVHSQYHAPIFEYIFPENLPGTPPPPNNFEALDFLTCGGYSSTTGTVVKQLSPWPGLAAPNCVASGTAPGVSATASALSVVSGATTPVTLTATATGTAPIAFKWVQTAGPAVTLATPTGATTTFNVPSVAATTTLAFTVTATNAKGSATATVNVTVTASTATPITSITVTKPAAGGGTTVVPAPATVASGTPVTMTAIGTLTNGSTSMKFSWLLTSTSSPLPNGASLKVGTNSGLSTKSASAPSGSAAESATFTLSLPVGSVTPITLNFTVTATGNKSTASVPMPVSVTVLPPPDTVAVTAAIFKIKDRLVINATSSIVSPAITLKLDPYLTTDGTIFDPTSLIGSAADNGFANQGAGLYILTLIGAPAPACGNPNGTYALPCPATPITVRSNIGGVSPASALTRIQ